MVALWEEREACSSQFNHKMEAGTNVYFNSYVLIIYRATNTETRSTPLDNHLVRGVNLITMIEKWKREIII